ncbi:MAG: type IVB secretion system protein IcmH/DotU [Deltaproteobacteria bacterium]|nr:type IVB secretion system protein IcmH/DotU [Candidatus Tharpella aukensis]
MNRNDQFSGFDEATRTVIRPNPGGRRPQPSNSAPPQTPWPSANIDLNAGLTHSGNNKLRILAGSLLSLVVELRNLPLCENVAVLQERVVGEISNFQNQARQQGYQEQQVNTGSYFLCSLIDETVLNTPWGAQSSWGHNSLLVRFHDEAWGGETFFTILDQLMQRPSQYGEILELGYLCLSLGFEGKYRVSADGRRALDQLHQDLYLAIREFREPPERELSPHWQGIRDFRNPLTKYVPLWVMVLVAGVVLMSIYLGFAFLLKGPSDRTFASLAVLASAKGYDHRVIIEQPIPAKKQQAGLIDRLKTLLAQEILLGVVEVLDGPLIRISGSFPSGKAQIRDEFRPILVNIAVELSKEANFLEVIGYTDNQPIFSARFPSNWDLSNTRAHNIAIILTSAGMPSNHIKYKGRGDLDPIVPNTTAKNRARNRRVEILVR